MAFLCKIYITTEIKFRNKQGTVPNPSTSCCSRHAAQCPAAPDAACNYLPASFGSPRGVGAAKARHRAPGQKGPADAEAALRHISLPFLMS